MLMFKKMEPLTEDEKKIVEENLRVAHFFVNKWLKLLPPGRYDRDDLLHCAVMGLMRSVKSWDKSKGSLSTYCEKNIHRAIKSWLICDAVIKPSECKVLSQRRILKKMEENPELTFESAEIRRMYHWYTPDAVKRLVETPSYVCTTSLEQLNCINDKRDTIPDSSPLPDEILEKKQWVDDLLKKIELIPLANSTKRAILPRDMKRIILRERYLNNKTLESIGKEFSVSKQRIKKLEEEALGQLRRLMK